MQHIGLPFRPLANAIAIAIALTAVSPAITFAQSQVDKSSAATQQALEFNIPAGSLSRVLGQFAGAADVALSFEATKLEGLQSSGLKGRYTIEQGFATLLSNSGYQAISLGNKEFTLRPVPRADVGVMKTVKVEATSIGDATEGSGSYTANTVGVGGIMGESLREVPRSLSVITRQQLDDQRTLTLYDAIDQLPGITTTFSGGNSPDASFYSRGHDLSTITADGMRISTPSHANSDTRGGGANGGMAKYDSVQLLRGPDSLFSGNGEPSGSINLIRKRSTDEFQLKTAISAGSWNSYAGEIDVSGPLTDGKNLRGRAVVAYDTSDHFYDGDSNRKNTFYGVLDADLWKDATLAVGASLDMQRGTPDQPVGLPRYSNGEPLDVKRSLGYPDWAQRSYDTQNAFALFEQRFDDNWRLKAGLSTTRYKDGHNVMSIYGGAVDPLTKVSDGSVYNTRADWDAQVDTANINLIGNLNLWGLKQQFAVGADFSDSSQYSLISYPADESKLLIPDWDTFKPDDFRYPPIEPGWDNDSRQKQQGIYAYGNFQIYGPVKLVVGGRYADFDTQSSGASPVTHSDGTCDSWATTCGPAKSGIKVKAAGDDGVFTPYYSLIVDISNDWTAYLTHAEGYEDQSNYYTSKKIPLDPTESKSIELGLKGEHFDGRLNTNITLYRSKRDNYAVSVGSDPSYAYPMQCCFSGDGKFLAKGIEVDISGALTDNWQINAGYTYDDNTTEYGDDDGKRYASYTPKQMLRLWTSYDLRGLVKGLRVGGGAQAQSHSFQNGTVNTWNPTGGPNHTGGYDGDAVDYTFTNSGNAIWNGFAEYRFSDKWSAALNINNLLNKRYWQQVGTTYGDNYYGAPRSVMLTLRGQL